MGAALAEFRGSLLQQGSVDSPQDLMIAAVDCTHDLTLVSDDVQLLAHFPPTVWAARIFAETASTPWAASSACCFAADAID